eukprot:5125521-Pyramimonas_sp.AAC.1
MSQTPCIRFSRTLSRPAFEKTSLILGPLAWNHGKCSFRSSRVTTLGSKLRRLWKLICTSNRDQSGSLGRAAGSPAEGGGGGSPPCCCPRLAATW